MGPRTANAAAAGVLTAFGAFEAWNHETDAWPFALGALAPALVLPGSTVPPFWLGIAGFFVPQGHRLQVAALGWSAHVFARRALSRA
ncbi:MAG: hypothetical protein ACXVZ4_11110 [Gaiellaceae bacterium]